MPSPPVEETFHDHPPRSWFAQSIDDLRGPTREFRRAAPEAWAAFQDLHRSAMTDATLPRAMKELIAVRIAVAHGCHGCIAYHARGAAMAGTTRDQASETLAVALLMAGGPASVWAPRALAAFDEFSTGQDDTVVA